MPRFVCLALAACGLAIVVGCGEEGPTRYQLSGKVTYGGQPIPAGSVTFIPDSSQGNSGPAASVDIVDGAYDTTTGKGHVGGPHLVKITALDGKTSDEFPKGMPMFPDYETKADLPKEDGTKDFDVPSDHVMPQQTATPGPTA